MAAAVAVGAGFAVPALSLYRRLALPPLSGGNLGFAWRAGVQPVAATQQEAVDALGALLLGASLATLAIAAVTILILSLAREAERSAEVSVRRAVGAGRRILLGSALTEGLLVALAGLALGGILGAGVTGSLADWPGTLRQGGLAGAGAGAAAAALVAMVLGGMSFPVLFPRRRIGEAESHAPAPLAPSAVQMAASLVALTTGALLARHAGEVTSGHGATLPAGIVSSIAFPGESEAERAGGLATLLHALEAHGAASVTSPGTLLGLGPVGTVVTDCGRCSEGGLPLRWRVKPATHHFVSADTFQMLGVRVVEGRGIASADTRDAPRVAVIGRSLAAREFQDGRAIGRAIRVVDDGDRWSTVVGVVDDLRAVGVGGSVQPGYSVYLSVLQRPPAAVELLTLPGSQGADAVPSVVRAALGPGALGPRLTTGALLAGQAGALRWFAAQFGLQGWAMLAIAAVGSLTMTRLWIGSLLGELGVRRALGARRARILAHVLLRAGAVGAAGIGGGIWFGAAIWGMLADLVPGLEPWDVELVGRYALVLMLCVLFGALPPAWRAARATPASLLSST